MDFLNTLSSPTQRHWISFLCLCAYALALFHLLFATFRYVVSYSPLTPLAEGEFWFTVILFAAFLLSFLIFLFFFPQSRSAIKNLFCKMSSYEQVFVALFPFWYIIICIVRQSAEHLPYLLFLKNEIAFTAVSGLVLFPLARFIGKHKSFTFIEPLLHLVVISYTVFTVLSLHYAFHLQSLVLPSGNQAGWTDHMMLSLGTYYNMTGAIACLMVCLSLYMVFSQKFLIKILYAAVAFIHLLVVVLSNSRTDFIGTLFVLVLATFCYTWFLLEKKKTRPLFLRVLLCIICSGLLGFLFWILRPVVISAIDNLIGFSDAMKVSPNALHRNTSFLSQLSSHVPSANISLLAASARKVTADLNGRGDIWLAALKVIFHSPLNFFFGVTPGGITDALCNIGGLTERFYGTHNTFLDVATEFGIPAFLAFMIFSVKIMIRCFRILFKAKNEDFKKIFMIPLTIFTLYVLNLTEGYLVGYFCVQSCIFFLFCGWILVFDNFSKI